MPSRPFFAQRILDWFPKAKRDLPWRKTRDPYRIWVSEIMLQQTQVDRVIHFYERFLERFPTIHDLAKASWENLMPVWRGLGYYSRGRNMLKVARVLVDQYRGKFPRDVAELEKFSGIGKYTARAIASFAFGLDVSVKDTNVSRVLQRFFGIQDEEVWGLMEQLLPKAESSNFNQGVMELGALVCTAFFPKCDACVLNSQCQFYQSGARDLLTLREKKVRYGIVRRIIAKRRTVHKDPFGFKRSGVSSCCVVIGLLYRDGKILIQRRRDGSHLGGMYEFPGGKLQTDEDERAALKREMMEELGIEVAVRSAFLRTHHRYNGQDFLFSFHRCQILLGEPKASDGQEIRWIFPSEMRLYQFPPANNKVLEKIPKMKW